MMTLSILSSFTCRKILALCPWYVSHSVAKVNLEGLALRYTHYRGPKKAAEGRDTES